MLKYLKSYKCINMEHIKLDNLCLDTQDEKIVFLSLNFIPFEQNSYSKPLFLKNPNTAEITEVKSGEKLPEIDGYVNGFFSLGVHGVKPKKDNVRRLGLNDGLYDKRTDDSPLPKTIVDIQNWIKESNFDEQIQQQIFRPVPSSFVELADKLQQLDNKMTVNFYEHGHSKISYDDIKIDLLQKEKKYFYNSIDDSISSIDKQSLQIKVEFDEDSIVKSPFLPFMASLLANNEQKLKRMIIEFGKVQENNNKQDLSYLSSYSSPEVISDLDTMLMLVPNYTISKFVKQTDDIIKEHLQLKKDNMDDDSFLKIKQKLLFNPMELSNDIIKNTFIETEILPTFKENMDAKITDDKFKNEINLLKQENMIQNINHFVINRAIELFNVALFKHKLNNGSTLEHEKQELQNKDVSVYVPHKRWQSKYLKEIYFDKLDKQGIEHVYSVTNKEQVEDVENNELKSTKTKLKFN